MPYSSVEAWFQAMLTEEADPYHEGSESAKRILEEITSEREARRVKENVQLLQRIARFCYILVPVFVLIILLVTLARGLGASLERLMSGLL